MTANFRLWEQGQVIDLLNAAADASGRTSGYVSLTNATKAYVVCRVTQGNAATVQFSVLQGVNGNGSSKAVTAMPIVADLDTGTSDTLVVETNATSFTTDAAEPKNKLVIFEVDPAQCMDINNGFNHIAVETGASNAANITSALLILMPIKDNMQTPPTTTGI